MASRVELEFRRHVDRLVPPGTDVLVAVSGGGDSIALAHLLVRRARGVAGRVVLAHLDHRMRPGSDADRRFVERLARDLGVPCVTDAIPILERRRPDESVEEAARRVRRGFLREVARRERCSRVALGHTLDDQGETVLMRLLRGAGPKALAAMTDRGPGPFVRPLLHLERAQLRRFLERRGLSWREDPSNDDPRFERNRIRADVLPLLDRTVRPRSARALVRAADRLREDAAWLDRYAARRYRRLLRPGNDGVDLDAGALARLDRPLALRVVRLALRDAGVPERRVSTRIVEAVLALAGGPRRRGVDLPADVRAVRRADRLVLRRPPRRRG